MIKKPESGLSRWARRKAAVEAERERSPAKRGAALPTDAADAVPAQAKTRPDPGGQGDGPKTERKAPAEDLPDIETLTYESDYSGFLSGDVSDAVRNIALRKLWRSNPLLANVDGLVDYDDDFTDAATVIEGMKSAYRVGRGMLGDETEEIAEPAAQSAENEPEHEKPAGRQATEPDDEAGEDAQEDVDVTNKDDDGRNDAA